MLHTEDTGSTFEIAWKAGLLVGLAYHLMCQYPQQSDVLKSLRTFAVGNVVVIMVVLFREERLSFANGLTGFLTSSVTSVYLP
jgi:hypothetical protein